MSTHTVIFEKTLRFPITTGEFLSKLSLQEKSTLFNELQLTFTKQEPALFNAHEDMHLLGNKERDLLETLSKIWASRNNWTPNQINRLEAFTKESYV